MIITKIVTAIFVLFNVTVSITATNRTDGIVDNKHDLSKSYAAKKFFLGMSHICLDYNDAFDDLSIHVNCF